MTNEMKLMMALCDALGFEVEVARIPLDDFAISNWNNQGQIGERPQPSSDYKLTKREDVALSLLREIVNGDSDPVNEYNLGVGLFKKIRDLVSADI